MGKEDYTIPYEVVKKVDEINHGLDLSELYKVFPTVAHTTLKDYKIKMLKEKLKKIREDKK